MSRLTAPLLSFSASGQIAKTMVASTWKGIPYMRKYVVPANPKTVAQLAQRALMTAAVSAWKNYITDTTGRDAWHNLAGYQTSALSGFNLFVRNCIGLMGTDPDGCMGDNAVAGAGNIVTFTVVNVDDGGTGDEAGDFEIWTGSSISAMTLFESVAIVGGEVISTDLGDTDDVLYVKIRKGGYDRSGAYKVTLVV